MKNKTIQPEIKKTTILDPSKVDVRSMRVRKIFSKIISSDKPALLTVNECKQDGELVFSIDIKDMGLTIDDIKEFKGEIFTNFFADFIGEFLVRENINEFMAKIASISPSQINHLFNEALHTRFGMKVFANKFEFSFHVSLLQKILAEDFKKEFWEISCD